MKLAILGGSFNPIHIGHLYLADTVLSERGYDRVLLIPARISPFKQDIPAAPAEDRLDMILASVTADPGLAVDDMEIRREGVSFTVDTVAEVIERYRPEGKPGLVIGDDLAADFHKWKKAEEIAAKTDIIIACRIAGASAGGFRYPCVMLRNDSMAVSSAMIRDRIALEGAPGGSPAWRSLVPPGARRIIEERGLYGLFRAGPFRGMSAPPNPGDDPVQPPRPVQPARPANRGLAFFSAAVEEAAAFELKRSRFLHSRNTALMAYDLARRYAVDPAAAYLAGIGHDLGKALDADKLLAVAERDGRGFSRFERKNPALLHGRAAAVLLRERFGIHNKDVLEAVAVHTTGARGMGPLAMVVFIADKIEYSRDVGRFRERLTGKESLEELFYAVLEDNIRYLKSEKWDVAEETLALESSARRACETGR
ncbi:MAG: nicotinate (nicotinamide) nucleotide adenylyltransferase [Treponema sp.]|nr:nicotinate (nicotinamide) nucleotide adenylyltransferase [Treponema sp.]